MSIFDSIKNAIFGHGSPAAAAEPIAPTATTAPATPAPGTAAGAPTAPGLNSATGTAISHASLHAQLAQMAAKSPQKLNWQTSIVDLMKLVGLDPSFANRKELAHELGFTGDTADSATMNIWLHKTVMEKLAESGGTLTPELKKQGG